MKTLAVISILAIAITLCGLEGTALTCGQAISILIVSCPALLYSLIKLDIVEVDGLGQAFTEYLREFRDMR